MVIKGKFADGSDLTAIPYYARYNQRFRAASPSAAIEPEGSGELMYPIAAPAGAAGAGGAAAGGGGRRGGGAAGGANVWVQAAPGGN